MSILIRLMYGVIVGFIFAILSKILNAPNDQFISLILILALLLLYIPTLPLTNFLCVRKFGVKPQSKDILVYVSSAFISWIAFFNVIY